MGSGEVVASGTAIGTGEVVATGSTLGGEMAAAGGAGGAAGGAGAVAAAGATVPEVPGMIVAIETTIGETGMVGAAARAGLTFPLSTMEQVTQLVHASWALVPIGNRAQLVQQLAAKYAPTMAQKAVELTVTGASLNEILAVLGLK
jgi:hypothetical protein